VSNAIAGWYPDPDGVEGRYRWWDGAHWTDAVGESVDALPPDRDPRRTPPPPARSRPRGRPLVVLLLSFALFVSAGIGVGLVVWRDPVAEADRSAPGLGATPGGGGRSTATAPTGQLDEPSRVATIESASMTLPGKPYDLPPGPTRVQDAFEVLFMADATVHDGYDGQRDWSAMVALAALPDSLAASGDLNGAAVAATQRLAARFFGGHPTTLRKVAVADQAVDGRPGVLVTAEVHYRVAQLPSRYDKVSALVVRLDEGPVVAGILSLPNDADPALTRLAQASLDSLQIA
jgi:hypothetical protein